MIVQLEPNENIDIITNGEYSQTIHIWVDELGIINIARAKNDVILK